jgi:hypothetical protein
MSNVSKYFAITEDLGSIFRFSKSFTTIVIQLLGVQEYQIPPKVIGLQPFDRCGNSMLALKTM